MAPINVPYARVVFSGAMPGGEVWACGLATFPVQISAQADATALAGSAGVTTLGSALAAINLPAWNLTKITVYHYLANATAATDVGSATLNRVGSSSSALPNQTALVTTLRSLVSTGRGRGRAYWPATGLSMAGQGLAVAAPCATLNSAVAGLFGSRGMGVVSGTAGVFQIVTRVTTDNRTDVIRARAGRLQPVTASDPVTTP